DRRAMQAEYDELGKELHNILENTKFNGEQLFSTAGKFSAAVAFQTGATGAEQLTFDGSAQLTALRRDLLAATAKFDPTAEAARIQAETTAVTTAQTNLNNAADEPARVPLRTALATAIANRAAVEAGSEITGAAGATTAIGTLTTALESVSAMRGKLGANINRLGHIANNLGNVKDNTDVARGRIMDTDFAKETSKATKNQMLTQSSIAMLKQTSQMPGMIMSLLG
ncbi:flagellin, partial [Pseudomonas alkylphenolica]|uniref:flagellin n=1 Tax=Pseudomonas alkylphenolica TaxID=237609 RepID=UPI003397D854